ncbi:HDOD domain-containing protein [Aestuariibacter sp. AA17]|uniref:HDOD domain-containing protein n=1 Tax=Fluctibacter corallii TaxID=2984329 RepID=A0ABT3A7R7_9ALTE|nr:HDOD domain-containing protein [Aestuariibacter sp. AA17]MCV2884660.1 HDOD domain-containing protein [Aestuariibacter sp. AA17]
MQASEILLARQPIYDRNISLYGFELLYRGPTNICELDAESQVAATVELLANICTNSLDDNMNLGLPLFVNIDQAFIESSAYFPAPSDNLILEILEHVKATDNVMLNLQQLKKQGYRFALDDYVFEKERSEFLPLVSIVKIDLSLMSLDEVRQRLPELRTERRLLLAEKVETKAMLDACLEMDFDLFQGYFLEYPTLIAGKKIDANKQLVIRLISELSRDDAEFDDIVDLISLDPLLTYKILLLVNSPMYHFVREIHSVKEAIIALGLEAVRRWAMIISLVSHLNQPKELFRTLLVRAKTLELYAEKEKSYDPKSCFLLGLFSGIDAILETDMENLLAKLTLSNELKLALLHANTPLSILLNQAVGVERLDADVLESLSTQQAYNLNQCNRLAMRWADETLMIVA